MRLPKQSSIAYYLHNNPDYLIAIVQMDTEKNIIQKLISKEALDSCMCSPSERCCRDRANLIERVNSVRAVKLLSVNFKEHMLRASCLITKSLF